MGGPDFNPAPGTDSPALAFLQALWQVARVPYLELHHPVWGATALGEPHQAACCCIELKTPDGLGTVLLYAPEQQEPAHGLQEARLYAETLQNLTHLLSHEVDVHSILQQTLDILARVVPVDFVFALKMSREGHQLEETWLKPSQLQFPDFLPGLLASNGSVGWEGLRTGSHRYLSAASEDHPDQVIEALVFPLHLTAQGEGRVLVVGRYTQGWNEAQRVLLESTARSIKMVHERGEYVRHLKDAALVDALTGLGNRRAFEEAFEESLSRAQTLQMPLGIMVLDLDGLKAVNDQQGHEQGDLLLRTFAQALRQHLRQQDQAYRLGGDEFAVILHNFQAGQLSILEQRLGEIRNTVRSQGFAHADASAGVAFLGKDGDTAGELTRVADERMYAQKSLHKNMSGTPGRTGSSLIGSVSPRMAWATLRSTLELLSQDQDASPRFWKALLEAAVQTIPSVEAGSMDVWRGGCYVVAAQVGYSDGILGLQLSENSQLKWYGQGQENYLKGVPRLLYGADIARHSSATIDPDTFETFDGAGSILQVKSTVLLPIVVDGHPVAHMNLDNHTMEQAFSREALELAMDFAAQVGALLLAQQRRDVIAQHEHHMQLLQAFIAQPAAQQREGLIPLAVQLLNTSQVTLDPIPGPDLSLPVGQGFLNIRLPEGTALSSSGLQHLEIACRFVRDGPFSG